MAGYRSSPLGGGVKKSAASAWSAYAKPLAILKRGESRRRNYAGRCPALGFSGPRGECKANIMSTKFQQLVSESPQRIIRRKTNVKNLFALSILALAFAVPSFAQDMSCTKTPGHDICQFADGNVIETFSSPGHYSEFHWNSTEWNEEQMKRHPAQSTAACLAGKRIEGEDPCVVIYESCEGDRKHPRFTKRQCEQVKDDLNQP